MISDKQAIVSDSEVAFQIRSTTDRKFKFVICGLLICCFIVFTLIIIFASLFAIKRVNRLNVEIEEDSDCIHNPTCLQIAAYHAYIANKSASPCENFHNYACGNYKVLMGYTSSIYEENTPDSVVEKRTRDKLETILSENNPKDGGYEEKIKTYYSSCMAERSRDSFKGKPLVSALKQPSSVGPWWLFDQSLTKYSLQYSVEEAYRVFDADVFFKLQIVRDEQHDVNDASIKLGMGGLGINYYRYNVRNRLYSRKLMSYRMYVNGTKETTSTFKKKQAAREVYKRYIRTVAQFLVRDNGMSLDSNVNASINTFVSDVYEVEGKIAYYYSITSKDKEASLLDKRVKMTDLSKYFQSTLNFVELFDTLFSKNNLETHVSIILEQPDYLTKLGSYVANDLIGISGTRKLNNYITWRVINARMRDLSTEYRGAYFTFVTDYFKVYYTSNYEPYYQSAQDYCFNQVSKYFGYGLGALFVRQHFSTSSKNTIDQIVTDIRDVIIEELKDAKYFMWMDETTKQIAIKKLQATTDRVGYPDWLEATDLVNEFYKDFATPDDTSYFEMQSSLAKFLRKYDGNLLAEGFRKDLWPIKVYDVLLRYWNYYNQLLVPAGRLQFPFMAEFNIPNFLNYGSVGQLIAHEMIHAIDDVGRMYDAEGKRISGIWWSNVTNQNYNDEYTKAEWYYGNQTAGPYKTDTSEWKTFKIDPTKLVVREGLVEIGSVKWAAAAYQKWISRNSPEKRLPGLIGKTTKQQFYLAFAQNNCFVRSDAASIENVAAGDAPEDVAVNAALGQNEDFLNAFGCSSESQLGSKRRDFKVDVY